MNRLGAAARPFQTNDLAVLQRFARQAALALRNATLFGQAEQRRRAAQELARLARTLSDRLDPVALGAEIVQSFHSLFPELSCTIRLLRPDGALVVAASTDFEPGHVQVPGTGLTARVLAEGHAVWSLDRLGDPALVYDEELRRRVEDMGLRAGLVVPLRTERGILGVLQVSAHDAREFSAHEAELAQAYADQSALTLEGARLFEALQKSEARYRELFENSNDPMASATLDGFFTSVNRAMERLLGRSRQELVGRHYSTVVTAASVAYAEEHSRRALAGERPPLIWEAEFVHESGKTIAVECSTRFLRDQTRRHIGWEGVFRDVTARKEMEAALRQAKEAAESASRAKSSFLANMSHELRTPLNGILGYVQVLRRDGGLGAKQDAGLTVIEQSGEHLLGLIDEILDLAKIETGTIAIQPTTFDLRQLLEGIVETIRARAQGKGLRFVTEWPTDLPRAVRVDERRLRQVLMNLLDNAIKYTHQGTIAFTVERSGGRTRFVVEDTGIGIRPEDLADIFEAFRRVPEPRAFVEGAGLGLAISRALVALLGGTLEVASTPGEGSRFWFELDLPEGSPLGLDFAQPMRRIAGIRGGRRRVLIVDDKEDNRRLLCDLLEPLGFQVSEAPGAGDWLAEEGLARFDAILLDLRMPGLDGLEITRRIRALERERRVVIIAVSASAFEHHREQCLEAGTDDFIAKPFRLERLLDMLCRPLGLDLIYAEKGTATPPSDDAASGVEERLIPAPAELAHLLDLARRGDVKQVLEGAARLEGDPRLGPFTRELRRLAEQFQIRQLCQFLERAGER